MKRRHKWLPEFHQLEISIVIALIAFFLISVSATENPSPPMPSGEIPSSSDQSTHKSFYRICSTLVAPGNMMRCVLLMLLIMSCFFALHQARMVDLGEANAANAAASGSIGESKRELKICKKMGEGEYCCAQTNRCYDSEVDCEIYCPFPPLP